MTNFPSPSRKATPRVPPVLIGGGILVVALGFGLPRLLLGSGEGPVRPESAPSAPALPAVVKPAIATPSEGPGLGVAIARLVGSLVVVCGFCVLVTRLVTRRPALPKGKMELAAFLSIDLRCAVYLIRAGDRRLLVGIDPSGVKSLLELPGPPPEAVVAEAPAAVAARPREAALPLPPPPPAAVSRSIHPVDLEPVIVGPVVISAPAPVEEPPQLPVVSAAPPKTLAEIPPALDEIEALISRLRRAAPDARTR